MLAEIYKILGCTEIKTQIAVLKFQSAYHFTIPLIRSITKIGFETTGAEPVSYTHLTLPTNREV